MRCYGGRHESPAVQVPTMVPGNLLDVRGGVCRPLNYKMGQGPNAAKSPTFPAQLPCHCLFQHPLDAAKMKTPSQSLALLAALLVPARAGLRFPCSTLTTQRLDPAAQPGSLPSAHLHMIVGGNAFNATMWAPLFLCGFLANETHDRASTC